MARNNFIFLFYSEPWSQFGVDIGIFLQKAHKYLKSGWQMLMFDFFLPESEDEED